MTSRFLLALFQQQRNYTKLAGLKARGIRVSTNDLSVLEVLRQKAGR